MCTHLRKERFSHKRKSKLSPRECDAFKVLDRINDNTYEVQLPGDYEASPTFNMSDLSPYLQEEPLGKFEV